MKKFQGVKKDVSDFLDISDRRFYFFSGIEGNQLFMNKVMNSPKKVNSKPIIICDQEIKGEWNKYAKVWRFLYKESFPDSPNDHTFFMF